MEKSSKKKLVAGAAGLILAASGALPAVAAGGSSTVNGITPVGSIFSGTVETSDTGSLVVRRKRRAESSDSGLVAVDTDYTTIASRAGLSVPVGTIGPGTQVIVSGTRNQDGSVLASKIIVRS